MADEYKTLPIGTIFTYKGNKYQVCISESKFNPCALCAFQDINCDELKCVRGYCFPINRKDSIQVYFKLIENNITLDDIYENQGRDTFVTNVVVNNKHTYNKILAIAELMDIVNYYNKDWKPNWSKQSEHKYCILYDNNNGTYTIDYNGSYVLNNVYFKCKEDAKAVIDNPNFREILDAIFKN